MVLREYTIISLKLIHLFPTPPSFFIIIYLFIYLFLSFGVNPIFGTYFFFFFSQVFLPF